MIINLYSIGKNDLFADFYSKIIQQCRAFGTTLKLLDIFTPQIAKAQQQSYQQAQKSYTQAFAKFLSPHSYALHPDGKTLDSLQFAQILQDQSEVSFFIGGAYGFEKDFLEQTRSVSLSPLTLSHQIAKVVLCEQIYRGLSINAAHPYHK
ncbi:hypothetical protein BBW65_05495 [Helicobacter enhydrae]|uniref:Ribosomal RNA large subunit methyltransferase H n=1 Tax=Helicobacter enhydrae TaxID=222136 RepID=A0A1B1U661_9HELI|nr:23S rRNA (pseudouridine(1915)-N(3))-methyltransferase RlmH [Helicobacter enhydrae]ANV98284.1 hypothetical protein BBW65_05495 [Helicobacter enhydrae]